METVHKNDTEQKVNLDPPVKDKALALPFSSVSPKPEQTVGFGDFIEIEFTGIANGEIFDTTSKEEAKKIGLEADVKPMIISVGNQMLLQGLDENLDGKEMNKKYSVHLTPDKAFGKRNPDMIKIIPLRVFKEKDMNPYPGMTVQLDNYIAKILSVSGGRVSVDFNNPLAGKEIDYNFSIKRKITDTKEKINALLDFFLRMRFDFDIDETNKKVIFQKSEIKPFIEMFKDKFKTITGYDFEVNERKEEYKK
ncbi:MAG: peptidylprolyl isomerase [Candidatus Nanoarchaeia archaeon]|nr:peptidylprolyl isomerase [Candidatus Nanoarchaeia archaeon]